MRTPGRGEEQYVGRGEEQCVGEDGGREEEQSVGEEGRREEEQWGGEEGGRREEQCVTAKNNVLERKAKRTKGRRSMYIVLLPF